MNTHRTHLSIDNLQKAFGTAFTWVVERDRESGIDDFAGAWVDLLASALQDVRLTATPAIDADSPPLKFLQTHRIATEVFVAARSGMRGGPTIDVLLQVWFDTEEMFCGYGVPLIFRTIPHSGRMPDLMWSELQDVCRKVALATPCARVVLVAQDRDFDWYGSGYWDKNPIIAADAHSIAGQRLGEARERCDEQPLLPERRPVALRILQKLVTFRDPERLAAALAPVVEQDPGRLAALARPGAVTEEKSTTEAEGVRGIVGRGRDHVAGFIDNPRSGEISAMGFARVDHGLKLRVGEQTVARHGGREFGAVGGFQGRNGRHRRRLHQLGRVRGRPGDVDRLQPEGLVNRIRQTRGAEIVRCLAQSVGEVFGIRRGDNRIGPSR